jgi:hypothetical protein
MSSIAKIFIVVNLLLSALTLGWASTHLGVAENYKTQLATAESDAATMEESKDAEIATLRGNVSDLEASRDTVRSEKDQAVAMRDRNASDLEGSRSEASTLRARLDSIDSTLGNYASTNDNLQSRYEQSQSDLAAAVEGRRDAEGGQEDALAAQTVAQTGLDEANRTIAGLRTESTALGKQLANAQTEITILSNATGVNVASLLTQPQIDGVLLQVDLSVTPALIAINKGTADSVKRGYTFHVFSQGVYKGRARVETVQENMCTASIVNTYNGAQMSQGDQASTQL